MPDEPLSAQIRLDETHRKALARLRITSVRDLLYHFPTRYENLSLIREVADLSPRETATLYGTLSNLKTRKAFRRKTPIAEGTFEDHSGKIKVIWFHQPYLAKMFSEGSLVRLSGKVTGDDSKRYLANPEIERAEGLPIDRHDSLFRSEAKGEVLYPMYPETKGITSRWIRHTIEKMFAGGVLEHIEDPVPEEIRSRYHLPTLKSALIWIHAPKRERDTRAARKRFAFDEVFFIQLSKQRDRYQFEQEPSFHIHSKKESAEKFMQTFPFEPTRAQKRVVADILHDFEKPHAMARLLEGDVGSGKTAVAAATLYAIVITSPGGAPSSRLQAAYMAPTEILASQQFESLIEYFRHMPTAIGLLTGSGCKKFPSKVNPEHATKISRAQLLRWVESGEISILVGTHALIQKSVTFKNLAYVVIDEQHRFGVNQRHTLIRGTVRNERGVNAESKFDPLLYRDLTYRIRNALFKVKKTLGSGHKESVYHKALIEAFRERNLSFSSEVRIPVRYGSKTVGTYIPDFVVEDKIIIELKALPFIGFNEKRQLWNYLKGSEYKLALLVNFGPKELTIDRVVYESARDKSRVPASSAFVQQSSASARHASAFNRRSSALVPHLLSMTATPIPRTLALTIYGDLDLSLLDEMPKGRKPIITEVVLPGKREAVYEKIRAELVAGRQAYVICPRINEPDPEKELALNVKSVTEETKRLKSKVFPEYEIEKLHSKMTPAEKEGVMARFSENKIQILVATSVVEVGVNVENATVIVIEGAERFGLAQLHQLRGRVIRSNHQAYCYVFTESKSSLTLKRLKALTTAKNGFELAEYDLAIRGAGKLYGAKQSGLSDLAMEAMKNVAMVEAARNEAAKLIAEDSTLNLHPLIKEVVERQSQTLHLE